MKTKRRHCPTQRRHSPTKKRHLPTTFWQDFEAALLKGKGSFWSKRHNIYCSFFSKQQKKCTPGGSRYIDGNSFYGGILNQRSDQTSSPFGRVRPRRDRQRADLGKSLLGRARTPVGWIFDRTVWVVESLITSNASTSAAACSKPNPQQLAESGCGNGAHIPLH